MRSYQVFASMSPETATAMCERMRKDAPALFATALGAACAALKLRPVYLGRQPLEKRAQAIRRALGRVAADDAASEMLATYFLECRLDLLTAWLDLVGLEHEDGVLTSEEDPPPPSDDVLRAAVEKFRKADDDSDRELLLRAFAAQDAIDWPALESLLADSG